MLPSVRKTTDTIIPLVFITYGRERIPAPTAVYIKANILPLIDPGVKGPNQRDQQLLYFNVSVFTIDIS